MIQSGVTPGFFMDMIWGGGSSGFKSATQIGSLPLTILLLMAGMMLLSLNYQYVMRIIILGLLILIFPIVTTITIFPAYRHALQTWMKEFVAQVTLQLAHALALGVFFVLIITPGFGNGGTFWLMIAYFAGLPAIANLIRELLGLQGGIGGGAMGVAAGMAGISSLANMSRMFTRNPGGRSTDTGGSTSTDGQTDSTTGGSGTMQPKLSGATSLPGKIAQGAFNGASAVMGGASAVMGNKFVQGAAKGALGITAATAGAALSAMTTGNPLPGLAIGAKASSSLSRGAGYVANGLGSGVQTVAQTISKTASDEGGIKEFGQNMMAQSMQKGGILASTNWGLQAAANKLSSLAGENQPFAAPSFIKENRDTIRTAQSGMNELKPQMDLARAKYEQSLSYLGPDNQKTKDLHDQYQGLKGIYDTHEADARLAQTRLRSHNELQRYSASRGKL